MTDRAHDEPSVGGQAGGMFPSTRWTLVNRAGHGQATEGREALDELVKRYEPALLKYLRFVWRFDHAEAEDLLQSFLAEKVVRHRLIAHADRRRGRFRTFLKTVLDNYIRSEKRRTSARKRAPQRAVADLHLIDQAGRSRPTDCQPDMFDVEWARTLLQRAIDQLRVECEQTAQPEVWLVFSARLLKPVLHNEPPDSYEQLIGRLHYRSPSQVWNTLARAKRMFTRHLKQVIGEYARDEAELAEEIDDLFDILSRVGP